MGAGVEGGGGGLQVSRVLAVLANGYSDGFAVPVVSDRACRVLLDYDVALMATASSAFVTRCE